MSEAHSVVTLKRNNCNNARKRGVSRSLAREEEEAGKKNVQKFIVQLVEVD